MSNSIPFKLMNLKINDQGSQNEAEEEKNIHPSQDYEGGPTINENAQTQLLRQNSTLSERSIRYKRSLASSLPKAEKNKNF